MGPTLEPIWFGPTLVLDKMMPHHQTGLDLCNEGGGEVGFLDVPSLITLKHPTLFIFSMLKAPKHR